MGVFNKMRKICGDKSIKQLPWGIEIWTDREVQVVICYMQSEILQLDHVIFFFSLMTSFTQHFYFFTDIKVNDLGLDLLHCKYNIPLVQVF